MSAAAIAWKARGLRTGAQPLLLYLELTARCNSRCVMCYQATDPIRDTPDMPLELALHAAQRFFETAAVVDLRGFGETLVWTHLRAFLDHVAVMPRLPSFKLVTNAQVTRAPWEALAELGTHLRVSFDGPDRDTYERIRLHSSFDRALERIRWWNGHALDHQRAWLLVTVQAGNVDRLDDLVQLAASEGCRGIFMMPVVAGPGAPWAVHPVESGRAMTAAVQLALGLGLEVVFHRRLLAEIVSPATTRAVWAEACSAPWTSLLIRYDGRFSPCSHYGMNLGAWPQEDPVDHPRVVDVRAGLLNQSPVDHCRGCIRNDLAYLSPDGAIHDPTWRVVAKVHG